MTTTDSFEVTSGIPDRFYFNEMKREVIDASQMDQQAELAIAADFIDVSALGDLIEQAASQPPNEFPGMLNRSDVVGQVWQYTEHTFQEVAARRDYNYDDFRELSVGLCATAIRVAAVIDMVKVNRTSAAASTNFTNALISHTMMPAVMHTTAHRPLENDSQHAMFATRLADDAFHKTGMNRGRESWAWAKVHTTAEMLRGAMTMREILASLPELRPADTEMLRRQNDALAEASQVLLTYTPKPAVGSLEGTDIDALFVDREVTAHTFISSRQSSEFTHVQLFPHTHLSSSNVTLDYRHAYKDRGGIAKRITAEGAQQTTPHTEVIIHKSRELLLWSARLADFANPAGAQGQAELLTAMILSQNFDLTVPSYIVDLAQEEADRIPADPNSEPKADKLRRLLLARTRVLQTLGNDVIQEIDLENQDDDVQHRDLIKHGVVGHLRRLPNGYAPTQRSRELCQEQLGVEIPEGHTYVQIHTRGNTDMPSRGHRVAKNPKAVGRLGLGLHTSH